MRTDDGPGGSLNESSVETPIDLHGLQRRTVTTLVGSQVLGGVGLATGFAVGSILAEEIAGSARYAGLGGTFQVLGGALARPQLGEARSRRPGIMRCEIS